MRLLILFLLSPLFLFSQTQIHTDIDGELTLDNSGSAVSSSYDGSIIAIGSPSFDGVTNGLVRVFENNGNDWIQIGDDIIGEHIEDHFGSSVSISSDGSIIVIGAPDAEIAGYVQVYENIDDEWTQLGNDLIGQAEFIDGDGFPTNFSFGRSVSISDDGTVLAIAEDRGPWVLEAGYGNDGYLHMYENISGTWTLIDTHINTGVSYLNDVSLSGDGTVVAISGRGDCPWGDWYCPYGFVEVYKNVSGSWTQLGSSFIGPGGFENASRISHVSLTTNGSKIVIGGSQCKVYEFMEGEWIQQGEDIQGFSGYYLPNKVSISDNGSILAYTLDYGFIRIFNYNSGTWSQLGDLIREEAPEDDFGVSLELSGDGTTLIVGGPKNDGNGENAGHTRVYNLSALLSLEESNIFSVKLYPNPATNQFTIELPDGQTLEKVNIYNNLGQFIQTNDTHNIKTSHLTSGLYYVEVITNSGKATIKLILE